MLLVSLHFVAYHRLHSFSLVNVYCTVAIMNLLNARTQMYLYMLLLAVSVGLWNYNILLKERASKISGMACDSKIFYLMSLQNEGQAYPVTTGTVIIIAITCVNYTLNHL